MSDESGGKNSLTVFTYDVYIRLLSTAMRHKRVQPDTPRALQLHHHVDRSLERRDDSSRPAQRTLTDRGHESRPTLAGKRSGRSYGATASRPCETCWDTPNAQAIRRELTAPLPHCSACSAAASGCACLLASGCHLAEDARQYSARADDRSSHTACAKAD